METLIFWSLSGLIVLFALLVRAGIARRLRRQRGY